MGQKRQAIISGSLTVVAILSGTILASANIYADDVIDEVNITVPASCSLEGTGMTSHNANIVNGTVNSAIGETTMKAFCNDNEGFAIYAIGYTDNTDGKNVLTSSTLGSTHDIATGIATSGANSNWAMKLSTVTSPTPTYPITIQNSFDSFHTVPNDYTLVAKRTSATDVGQNAEGSTLKSTYQAYISQTQPAGTYTGQVKYTLVHPHNGDRPFRSDQIAVVYDGNGLTFANGSSTNRVIYGDTCGQMYRGTTPTIVKTSNLANDGTKNNAYASQENIVQSVPLNGADGVQVVIDYGLTDEALVTIAEGAWDGWDEEDPPGKYYQIATWNSPETDYLISGTKTYSFESDTVTIEIKSWNAPTTNYDYGVYAKVYPVYETEQTGTEEISFCTFGPISGTYAETTIWKDEWYNSVLDKTIYNENDAIVFLEQEKGTLSGTTVYFYEYNPYTALFNDNNATVGIGSMNNTVVASNDLSGTRSLFPSNFLKTNYGFAGWSENPNATANSGDRIYGPNETITFSDLTYNSPSNAHETTLYAVWVPSAGNLQNWTGCPNLTQGQVTALTDTRDNNTYAVAKLADGNCWMIENLRLDAANSSDDTKAQGFGGVFTGLANSESSRFYNDITTSNSKYSTSIITGDNQGNRFPRYNYTNTNSSSSNVTWGNANIRGYGNYYTWSAAMANTDNLITKSDSESANTSICPTGWKLPYGTDSGNGNTSGGFNYLGIQLGATTASSANSNTWRRYPNNFLLSGWIWGNSSSTISNRSTQGYYWTSAAYDSQPKLSYAFSLDSSTKLYPGTYSSYKQSGYSVRCIKQP